MKMLRNTLALLGILVFCFGVAGFAADDAATQEEIDKLKEEIEDLEKRVMKSERKGALDRIDFTGDFRFEAHSIDAEFSDYFDGMMLQRMIVDTLFYFGVSDGMPPSSPEDVQNAIRENYADYLYYLNNVVTFDWLKETLGSFPPEMVQQLMGSLLPYTYQSGYDYTNDIIYTNRLRLNMHADIGNNVDFAGRLSMYKVFGDSTGVQVFNGQPTSINTDGTTASVPNSDLVHVERAYFNWKGDKFYLSIGRRPSTGGAPLNLRNDEPRGGSPLGSVINYQFDGITVGWYLSEKSTARICYGIGYESGFGNGNLLKRPQDQLNDAWFIGLNWDIWNTDDMFIQTTLARATDITDGFNGLVVLPVDPVTGQEAPAPAVLRFTPSATVGNIDWASIVMMRSEGPLDWFVSLNYMESDPNPVTTPFGGLFSDPFDMPEKQDGYMYYLGARYNLPNDKTKIGLEFNHGSEYWFNMAVAEDDLFSPKTSARGDVWEAYVTHRIRNRFIVKFDYMHYDYDYSGSGWHLGAPKKLDSTPILGFQTPSSADKFMLSFLAKF
jgi:hypothetical protein